MGRTKNKLPSTPTTNPNPPQSVLVSWLGDTDLRAPKQAQSNELGPIARALLSEEFNKTFHEVVILCNRPLDHAPAADAVSPSAYVAWLRGQVPEISARLIAAELANPSDFEAIYHKVTAALDDLGREYPALQLTFHLSPGTPAMSAIWLLLAKTTCRAQLIRTSKEEGATRVEVPFDIYANFVPVQTVRRVERALDTRVAHAEARQFGELHFKSASMRQLTAHARLVAPHALAVLVEGESGTGKSQIASMIHTLSLRADAPFQVVNCGAIPPNLIESQLFGHVRGAFTGADQKLPGLIRAAHGGTLFLDEIGELPLDAQVKLLRVLQEGHIRPVGSAREEAVDVRLIAATNQSLRELVSQGRFREDLYYRISVAILRVPPLRDRPDDLVLLMDRLFKKYNEAFYPKKQDQRTLGPDALRRLQAHHWPGNVRELQNVLQRALLFSQSHTLAANDISRAIDTLPAQTSHTNHPLDHNFDIHQLLQEIKKHYILRALQQCNHKKTEAARLLGLANHQTLSNWMRDLALDDN